MNLLEFTEAELRRIKDIAEQAIRDFPQMELGFRNTETQLINAESDSNNTQLSIEDISKVRKDFDEAKFAFYAKKGDYDSIFTKICYQLSTKYDNIVTLVTASRLWDSYRVQIKILS